jgi:hypothetical protein
MIHVLAMSLHGGRELSIFLSAPFAVAGKVA